MTKHRYPLIVVMPVYEDSESARALMHDLARQGPVSPFVVMVDDGSVRDVPQASMLNEAGLSGEVVHLARNMGHQRAIATGIAYVASCREADAVVVMDSDGEDRPEIIPHLIEQLQRGPFDIVVAERRKRSESRSFRIFYVLYRAVFHVMTGQRIRFGNFTALSMSAVRRLAAMQELWIHFAASLIVSGLPLSGIASDRGKRHFGRSRMNFVSLTLHGLRSMMVFAEDVLVRVGLFCMLLGVVAIGLLVATVVLKIIGIATPGWFSVASGILVLILMQAGVLTFVTLMIAGVIRNAPPITRAQLDLLIASVESTSGSVHTEVVEARSQG